MTAAPRIVPAREAGSAAVAHAFTGGGDGASCWCRWLIETRAGFGRMSRDERRAALEAEIAADDPAPGLVALVDDAGAGWVRVGPRPAQPGVLRTRVVRGGGAAPPDDPAVWAVTCFVVRREHRGGALAAALLDAAVAAARAGGARLVEGYPVDRAERPAATAVDLWHGTVGLFARAGFTETARPVPARPVMTLRLD
jgi:GNAT superfamily N-acetyltransferase